MPEHVAIIMDGNGRWAKQRGLPRAMGHRKGVEAVRETVRAAGDAGVKYLTLFAFSSENWRRPEQSDRVQKMTDETISEIDRLLADKEKEIMQV